MQTAEREKREREAEGLGEAPALEVLETHQVTHDLFAFSKILSGLGYDKLERDWGTWASQEQNCVSDYFGRVKSSKRAVTCFLSSE